MKKLILTCAICTGIFTSMVAENSKYSGSFSHEKISAVSGSDNSEEVNFWIDSLYSKMKLEAAGLSRAVFFNACKGYEYLLSQNDLINQDLLTICDYSQSSSKKRLYILDMNKCKVLFNTYVSHGRNSGDDYATSFSNNNESHKSSLGFMRTAETYVGEHGLSLKLDGMENGFNSNVRARSIVVHGSDYVSADRATSGTLMGRSYGCPAVPAAQVNKIINCIKSGSCFFSYYPDKNYTANSKIINADFTWPAAESMQIASVKMPDSISKIIFTDMPVN